MKLDKSLKSPLRPKGSTIVELIIVVVLFVVMIPSSIAIYLSASKISGQAYVQHQAAVALGETNDIIRYLRNQGFNLLENGDFYLIRNPGAGTWLVKNDLPDQDIYERHITVSSALRHQTTNDLYFPGDVGASYEDTDTKQIDIDIIWSPDYLALDQISHAIYITNWQKVWTYPSV